MEFANQKSREFIFGFNNSDDKLLSEVLMNLSNAWYDKLAKNESSGTFDMVPSNIFLDELSLEDSQL